MRISKSINKALIISSFKYRNVYQNCSIKSSDNNNKIFFDYNDNKVNLWSI